MPIRSYPIWKNKALVIPLGIDKRSISTTKSITWGSGTTINSTQMFYSMQPGLDGVECFLDFNDIEIAHEAWNIGQLGERTGAVDILSLLVNGQNLFRFRGDKGFLGILQRTITISASIVIDYEGDEPDGPENGPDWVKILLYGTAFAVSTVATVVTIKSLREKEQ